MQDYLGSRPQLERGALGSAVIAGGVEMKLSTIWFCGNRGMAKTNKQKKSVGGQARTFVDLLEVDIGVPKDYLPAAMDDRLRWRKTVMGERGEGEGGGGRLRSI